MYNSKDVIYEFETKAVKNKGYVGFEELEYKHIWKILKAMFKNSIYNLTHSYKRYVKIWAIDDNENNYNIYVENYHRKK